MTLSPQIALSLNGHCEAAFNLYARVLNGTITFMLKWGDSPVAAETPPGWEAKIYHATLKIGTTVILGGDIPLAVDGGPLGFEFVLPMNDPGEAERVFGQLSDGGTIRMPLQETHWARRFGVLVDQFGIVWSINCE